MSKRALGKGIEALIKDIGPADGLDSSEVLLIPIDSVESNQDQPRKEFSEEKIEELAQSIREKGIIQPIIVNQAGSGENYTVIAGERRLRAAARAGLVQIPAIVREFTPQDRVEIALIENIQREDLTPVEEAETYSRLLAMGNLSQEELAKHVGKSRSSLANALRLLKLPEQMLKALGKGIISPGHARALLSVRDSKQREELYAQIIENGISVRQAEALVSQAEVLKGELEIGGREKSDKKRNPELQKIEQKLIDIFGTKVKIAGTLARGRIEISYFSMDGLAQLLEEMGVK